MKFSELRFAEGNLTSEGVIEVRLRDDSQPYPVRYTKWMKVCYEYDWDRYDVAAICGQLGFRSRRITDFVPLTYEQSDSEIASTEGDARRCVILAIKAVDVINFAELVELPAIKQLTQKHAKVFALLNMFTQATA